MGLLNKVRAVAGAPPTGLMEHGVLGRGIITGIRQTGTSTGPNFDPKHVCVFTLEVSLDNEARFTATCRQAIQATILPQLMGSGTTVAVRVNPDDHSQIAIDLASEPPVVTVSAQSGDSNMGSAAQILEDGLPCRIVIVETLPLGKKNAAGVDLYAFMLTIMAEGRQPFQTQIGMPVPADALPLLYPGNNVPGKRLEIDDHHVMIDWETALSEATVRPGAPV